MTSPQEPIKENKKPTALPLWTIGGVLQVLAAMLWIPQAWVLAQAIGSMMTRVDIWHTAVIACVWFIGLGLVRVALDALGARISYLRARKSLSALRINAVKTLSMCSPLDTDRPTSGAAASVLTEQAEMIVPYLSRFQPVKLKVMMVPWAILVAIFSYSWLAALVLLCAAPLIPVFMVLIGYGAQKASQKQMLELGQMNSFLLDRLRGLATIRAFNAVGIIAKRLRMASETVRQKSMAVLRIAFLTSAVVELFSSLGVAMVAVYIGFNLLGNDLQFGAWGERLTLAKGMFILLLAPTFFDPLKELSSVWHDRASGVAAMNAMNVLTRQGVELVGQHHLQDVGVATYTQPHVVQEEQHERQQVKQEKLWALSVRAKHVGFQYPGSAQAVLKNFNLDVQAGQKVALVAPSGYGKSTLLALFAGLLPINEGTIEIGGVSLSEQTADQLRTHMGWISQQPHIFAGTLLQNITLGRPDVLPQEVQKAIDASALTHIAQGQLQRPLGEGGMGLSGGEILRLALARAFVTPQLGLLLADEPTAHLDSDTAQEVVDGLMSLAAKGVTLIVATHDERLLPYMDQVIRLDEFLQGDAA